MQNKVYIQFNEDEEEEKKGPTGDEVDMNNVDLSYLNQNSKSGAVFVTCKHFAHFKCLSNYIDYIVADTDIDNLVSKMDSGLDIGAKQFQCPVC